MKRSSTTKQISFPKNIYSHDSSISSHFTCRVNFVIQFIKGNSRKFRIRMKIQEQYIFLCTYEMCIELPSYISTLTHPHNCRNLANKLAVYVGKNLLIKIFGGTCRNFKHFKNKVEHSFLSKWFKRMPWRDQPVSRGILIYHLIKEPRSKHILLYNNIKNININEYKIYHFITSTICTSFL